MRSKRWANDAGWTLSLHVTEGVNASLTLCRPGDTFPVFNRVYERWEMYRAEGDARGVAELGQMEEIAYVRA